MIVRFLLKKRTQLRKISNMDKNVIYTVLGLLIAAVLIFKGASPEETFMTLTAIAGFFGIAGWQINKNIKAQKLIKQLQEGNKKDESKTDTEG